jgi:transketolase
LPVIDREGRGAASLLARGAYVLADPDDGEPEAIVIATGSEVWVALEAQEKLAASGVPARVVAMPSWEIFASQHQSYRDEVLPPEIMARVSIEAAATFGWERWIGDRGIAIGIDRFGASAPGEVNLREFGFTPERVVGAVRQVLERVASSLTLRTEAGGSSRLG